jgi:hypothetical protein
VTATVRSALRLAGWVAGLLVAGRVALSLGGGGLSVPLTSPGDLRDWASDTGPDIMAVAILRLGLLAGIGYLLVATVLTTAAEIVHLRPLTALAERVTPGLVQRIAQGGGGIGLILGTAAGLLPVPDPEPTRPQTTIAAPGPGVATMTRAADPAGAGPQATMTPTAETGSATATMTRADAPPPGTGPPPPAATPPMPATPPVPAPAPAPAPGSGPATWVVEPGDSFWSIAEDVVGSGDERVAGRYWRALIDANRSRLVDPGNPDLLIAGQELVVPPP